MNKSIVLSAAVLAASFSFCPASRAENPKQPEQQAGQLSGQVLQDTQQKGKESAAKLDDDAIRKEAEPMFAKHAAADNEFEIQLAQYVDQQSQNQPVKELAQTMIRDHQQAQQQLEQIARGMNVELSNNLEPWQQAKLDAVRQMHGDHLDRAFAFGEVGDHHTDILMFQYEAEHGQNQQLKDFAQQTIPTLEKHLRLAEEASAQWVSEARTAGERIRGANDSTGINSNISGSINGTNGIKVGGATEGPNSAAREGVNNSGVNR